MNLEYNGVAMELLELDQVSREGVYSSDGQELIGVKWIISATCTYAPGGYPVGTAVTSISGTTDEELYPPVELSSSAFKPDIRGKNPLELRIAQRNNSKPGAAMFGFNAVVTDTEIRSRLWQPRQKLILWVWDNKLPATRQIWMESPKPNLVCDIAGGPKPLAVDVISTTGEGLNMGIHFQIMTILSPCPNGSDRLILSHRWQMTHTHDADQYLTRVIDGEIVFNQGLMETADVNPDWLRSQFLHPIPLGMKRTVPTLTRSSDGATIRYQIVDTDTTIMFDAGDSGATNIDIVEQVSYLAPQRLI